MRAVKYLVLVSIAIASLSCFSGSSQAQSLMSMQEMQDRLIALEKIVAAQQDVIGEYRMIQTGHSEQHATIMEKKVGKVMARKDKKYIFAHPVVPGELSIGANVTGVVQASPNTKLVNDTQKEKVAGSYQANITITNQFENIDGFALANLRIDQGAGLEDEFSMYSNVDNNVWNDDHFTLSELFYQQNLFDKKVSINFGKLDPTVFFDKSAYSDSDTSKFLARIFNNSPVIEFPANSYGVRAAFMPFEWLMVDSIVMSGNSDLTDLQKNLFYAGEITFKPEFYGRKGNYRVLTWLNTDSHTKWDNFGTDKKDAYGLSISCDQEITDTLGVFGKFGWQNPKVFDPDRRAYPISATDPTPWINNFSLEYMWSGGAELKGSLWGREHDFAGIAIGQAIPSNDMKDSLENTALNRNARNETHFETYYNFYINEYLAISPGVQLVWDPYGGDTDSNDAAQVYTLRSHVDF